MKKMNKIIALILTLVMTMSFTVVANADGEGTLQMPIEITGVPYSDSIEGNTEISRVYSLRPAVDGGFLIKQFSDTAFAGENKSYSMTIYSKGSSAVYEKLSYDKGKKEAKTRLFLKKDVEYIIETKGSGSNGLGYTLSVESVASGGSLLLSGAETLSLGSEMACTMYPFANRRAFAWYTFTAPKDSCYEFVINNKYDQTKSGEIVAELRDETFSPTNEEYILYLYEKESGTISYTMKAGESCYIQISEQQKGNLKDEYNVGITVKEHTHQNKIVVDGKYVMKGCPCELDEAMEYAFWLDSVKLKNVTYTGKKVVPSPTFEITEVYRKDGSTISIPESAYSVTVTTKNYKGDVGTAKAKVKFKGSYKKLGSYTVSFKIVPKGTTLSSVKAGEKSFTAKWKKQSSKTTGYELRYSTNINMASAKTVAVKSNKTVSKKVSKLKEGTIYYVQVRTYKTVSGKKYYSSWSTKTQVTTN